MTTKITYLKMCTYTVHQILLFSKFSGFVLKNSGNRGFENLLYETSISQHTWINKLFCSITRISRPYMLKLLPNHIKQISSLMLFSKNIWLLGVEYFNFFCRLYLNCWGNSFRCALILLTLLLCQVLVIPLGR